MKFSGNRKIRLRLLRGVRRGSRKSAIRFLMRENKLVKEWIAIKKKHQWKRCITDVLADIIKDEEGLLDKLS